MKAFLRWFAHNEPALCRYEIFLYGMVLLALVAIILSK